MTRLSARTSRQERPASPQHAKKKKKERKKRKKNKNRTRPVFQQSGVASLQIGLASLPGDCPGDPPRRQSSQLPSHRLCPEHLRHGRDELPNTSVACRYCCLHPTRYGPCRPHPGTHFPNIACSPTVFQVWGPALELVASQLPQIGSTASLDPESDTAAIARLGDFAGSFLSPLPTGSRLAQGETTGHYSHVAISVLDRLTCIPGALLDDAILLAIIPYVDAACAWSEGAVAGSASQILSRQFSQRNKSDFIVSVLLENTIKPQLSTWKSTRLTAAGRVAAYERPGVRQIPNDDGTAAPWAAEGAAMIPLFQWALDESDVRHLLQKHLKNTDIYRSLISLSNIGLHSHPFFWLSWMTSLSRQNSMVCGRRRCSCVSAQLGS